jgi:hypothetical protein
MYIYKEIYQGAITALLRRRTERRMYLGCSGTKALLRRN